MQLKYAAELARFPKCPPDSAVCCERTAFRFVHSDINDHRNFLPVAKITPQRRLRPEMRCAAHGLSFWATKDQALAAHRSFREQFPNFEATAGSHLASGILREADGRACPVRHDGHFTFFEFATSALGPGTFAIDQKFP